ncbi:MAG: C40 family peptidase, partial [Eggerthellaceae bacterium]|nr:C40 family peptidase [Eggerthellaceae bacterium]
GINEEILTQIIKDSVKAHSSELELTNDDYQKLYYEMQNVIADLIGEEDPFAFVYDEIVGLHAQMNWWSDRYDTFTDIANVLDGPNIPVGSGSGTDNKYGYPNSAGYDEEELANWDGFNEVSVYGISEAGTGAVTADGTRITNTWNDSNMGIACEGLQNSIFAYWSSDYKAATGVSDGEPVKITLYNPLTGKSITAQVIDCGGWRGYNTNYAGMNADRQWDLLPAVWKALGGSESAGTMKVYWKVDPDAVVGEAALEKKSIEGYLWPKETDENNDVITITRPTLIVHDIQDALNNDTLMERIIDREAFATDAEFKAIKSFIVTKVKDVMKTLLTMENSEGETYVDYNYVRRNLGDPFGNNDQGNPREWVITHRFNPGYEDFDDEKAYVEIKPLDDMRTVRAILKGEVEEIDGGTVTIRSYIDTANSSEVVYSELTDIRVEEGDEVKQGQKIGAMANETLRISYYEINDAALLMETKKDWAYDPGLYMIGFAGYEEPAEPEEYIGPTSDYSGCQTVVEFAYSRLGCPYVWGATGPNTFDCSGLTQWCYAQAGITIPRNSEAQHDAASAAGNLVSLGNLQPGDILWRSGHVGIYVGDGKYIHAPHTGDVVKVSGDIFSFQCGLRFS